MNKPGWIILFVWAWAVWGYAAPNSPIRVIVELDDPPVAQVYAEALWEKADPVRATQKQLDRIETAQQALLNRFDAKSGLRQPLFRVQRVFNGVALCLAPEQVTQVAHWPGVRAVHRLNSVRLHNSTSVPFLGAPPVWNYPGLPLTGQNISVGIVDTGIDYVHPDFGGTGSSQEYQANDPTVLGDIPFPTAKVVGGYDFCGDNYDSSDPFNDTPMPDPDPMDKNGHGTHVAGTVAGFGVTSYGAVYSGPYSETTPFSTMKIGPGVAPQASLYALKIFGTSGGSDLVLPALEWALDPNADGDFSDHLDVLNMSFGEPFGAADSPDALACGNAVAAGIIIVASAGNSWDTYFSAGTPASAASVISVAASEDLDPAYSDLSPDRIANFSSRGPCGSGGGFLFLKPDLSAPGRAIRSAAAHAISPSTLYRDMSGTSMAAPHIAGAMALLRQQHPEWSTAELKALLMNNAANVYSAKNYGEPRCAPARAGAGRAQINLSTRQEIIAFDADAPEAVSVTFQTREAAGQEMETRTVRVLNKGADTVSCSAAVDGLTEIPGIAISLYPASTGPIAPGAYADVTLHLQADAASMQHSRDPAAQEAFGSYARYWISEVSGYVLLTPEQKADTPLRVPFYGAIRPVSDMHAGVDLLDVRTATDTAVPLQGQSLITPGPFPLSEQSLVSAFALLCYSPDETSSTGIKNGADILYIGASSDYADCLASGLRFQDATIYIAIATQGNWFSPHWPAFNIYIDTNKDGFTEFRLRNFHHKASETEGGPNADVFTARLDNFGALDLDQGLINYYAADARNTVPFMTSVMILPLRVRDIGLTEEDSSFAFRVESLSSLDDSESIDQAPPVLVPTERRNILYDPAHPGLDFRDGAPGPPMVPDLDGSTLPVHFDGKGYYAAGVLECEDGAFGDCTPGGPLGLLLLHHHNRTGDKAEWLPVMTAGDTDGDGLPDTDEGTADTDGDGLPNLVDRDSDNDGIPDKEEGAEDPDRDGIPNYLDTDSDGDGIPDIQETTDDADNDGIPNYLDTDSDDDTLSDSDEANVYHTNPYLKDSDDDGLPDNVEGFEDPDNDGLINPLDPDSDGDSIPDKIEGMQDADEDGIPNFLDLDSDNDGIPDRIERNWDTDRDRIPNFLDPDSDNDGIPDKIEGTDDPDTDGAGNYVDVDSDGDGIPDQIEGLDDPDNDTLPNFLDLDSDGDGIPDQIEGLDDPDNDTLPNFLDLDSDNDTWSDALELQYRTNPYSADTDKDGIPDAEDGAEDPDNDRIINARDDDSDGDGIPDAVEGTGDPDEDGIPNFLDPDSDADGIPDAVEGDDDPDSDGRYNALDDDSDGDGIPDSVEGTEDPDEDGSPNFLDLDSDDDTWPDTLEMQYNTNPYSNDTDNDGIPDAEDGAEDPDDDGIINARDDDSDGDGIPDAVEGTGDPDEDSLPNFLDLDSDGDGIPDSVEGMEDPDTDTIPNFLDLDSDGDTLADLTEGLGDADNDTIPNYLDLDADDDGLTDLVEATEWLTNPYASDTDEDGRPDGREVADGTDPRVANPPSAPTGVTASDGAFTDRVQVIWTPLAGSVEYQVFRREKALPETTVALGSWQQETTYDDFEAVATREIPGHGCQGPQTVQVFYEYWVQARIAPGNAEPTSASPDSLLDEGSRAQQP